jgi:hypothetical protein
VTTVGVTGHQSLPPEVQAYVEDRLRKLLADVPNLIGISSLASGADQLFARVILGLGGTLDVLIPSRDYDKTFKNGHERMAYQALLAKANNKRTLAYSAPSERAFMAAGRQIVDCSDQLIAIWNGQPAKGLGGTADVVAYARARGVPISVIWPSHVAGRTSHANNS